MTARFAEKVDIPRFDPIGGTDRISTVATGTGHEFSCFRFLEVLRHRLVGLRLELFGPFRRRTGQVYLDIVAGIVEIQRVFPVLRSWPG